MVDVRIEVKRLKEIQKKLTEQAQLQPFNEGIKKITLALQREAMVATPVDTGRLRASITPKLAEEKGVAFGLVGTNVSYAPFVEYGTKKMEARHVSEGSSMRVKGKGMFAYGLEKVQEKLGKFLEEIGVAIQQRWNQ